MINILHKRSDIKTIQLNTNRYSCDRSHFRCVSPMADLGGCSQGVDNLFSIYVQLLGKFGKRTGWRPRLKNPGSASVALHLIF